MIKSFILSVLILVSYQQALALAEEAVVIEVRKKVKLHDMERVYADYFIRGGTKLGLSRGTLVSVVRRVPVHDPFENASVGDFNVKVADIEIIEVDSKKAIGRLVEIDRREARPMLTYDAIMIGDRLDLTSMRRKVGYYPSPQSVFDSQRSPASKAEAMRGDSDQMSSTLLTNP